MKQVGILACPCAAQRSNSLYCIGIEADGLSSSQTIGRPGVESYGRNSRHM